MKQEAYAWLLGRTLLTPGADGLAPEPLPAGPAFAIAAARRLSERAPRSGWRGLVYEPGTLAHERVDVPRVGRKAFSSLVRVRQEYPAVASQGYGWSVDHPEPSLGGLPQALLHFETEPALARILEACSDRGLRIRPVWSLYSVAAALRLSEPLGRLLVIAPEFVAVACLASKRGLRTWNAPVSEADWRSVEALLLEPAGRAQGLAGIQKEKTRIGALVLGDPHSCCPAWEHFLGMGVCTLGGHEVLERVRLQLRGNSLSDLSASIPVRIQMDRAAWVGVLALLAASATLGLSRGSQARSAAATASLQHAREMSLAADLEERRRLHASVEAQKARIAAARGDAHALPHEALLALAEALPPSASLSSYSLNAEGSFRIRARFAGGGLDAVEVREAMARAGYACKSPADCTVDARQGTLDIRGSWKGTAP